MKLKINDLDYQVNFKHYYVPIRTKQKDNSYKVEVHPKATRCTIICKDNDNLFTYQSYSICDSNDQFSKELGRFQSLINCLRENSNYFTNQAKKEIIGRYVLEFQHLEKIALNALNLYTIDCRYVIVKKADINDAFYNQFMEFHEYTDIDTITRDCSTNQYLYFDKTKDDPKEFIWMCVLEFVNNKYKQYYSY